MPINRDRLVTRCKELNTQLEQAKVNLYALQGALADLDFLLTEDTTSETETKESEVKTT